MKEYFILERNRKRGPFSINDLKKMDINSNTLVWSSGMEYWEKLSDIEDLKDLRRSMPPPAPIKNGFFLYLKKNYKYIILSFVLSFFIVSIFDHQIWKYVRDSNPSLMGPQINNIRDKIAITILLIGLFIVPISYIFKKKK